MAKAKSSDILSMAAVAGVGLFAFMNRDKLLGKLAPAAPVPEPATLPAVSPVTPQVQPIIQPVQYVVPQTALTPAPNPGQDSMVVWTPYGPVTTSNFNPLSNPRIQEIVWRVKYLNSGILDAQNAQKNYPPSHPDYAAIAGRINTLAQKRDSLILEYRQLVGNQSAQVPAPSDMNAYRDYLRSKGWCDPLNGVPCGGPAINQQTH